MAASLKERLDAFKAVEVEEKDYKAVSGNTEQPDKVGKLSHSYLEKDDKSTPAKRNFTVKADKKSDTAVASTLKQRLSFGIFGKKKRDSETDDDSRTFSTNKVDVMNSKARDKAGIALNAGGHAPPPKKRLSILGRIGPKAQNNSVNAYNLVHSKSRADEVEALLTQIQSFRAFKPMKRLSIRDNDIVQAIHKIIANDPKQTKFKVDGDVRFSHLRSTLIQDFGDSIRHNCYLKSLTIRGVELGNTFLEALASAIRDNVTLEEIDISRNHLTHDAMLEFCQALEQNHTIKVVFLQTQLKPLYEKDVEQALASLEQNHSVKEMKVDLQDPTGEADKKLKEILQRNDGNTDGYEKPDPDELLISYLKEEVVRAEELFEQNELEKELEEVREGDWDYLYELSELFDKFRIQSEIDDGGQVKRPVVQTFASPMHEARTSAQARTTGNGSAGKNPLTGAQGYPSDGSFLTEEFIDMYLEEDAEKGALVFNFCNQGRLFKIFPALSPDRENIVNMFTHQLMHHPRQHEFSGINMTNTGCGDDFWVKISEGVLEDPSLLPNIHLISAETNFLQEKGIVAIANLIKSEESMRYIQAIKLDNQKALTTTKAERSLARAMCVNLSVVRFSLRVRNLLERDQCNKYVIRNIDFLRQARRHHKISTGTLKARKRNDMEKFFDSIAANDDSITEVDISGDVKYTGGLSDTEKVKSAQAFANNTHVTKVTMNALQLGDNFAIALGKALTTNETIERLIVEGNAFTGAGFKGLFEGLGMNNSVLELRAKHQSKNMTSPDEQAMPLLLESNKTITKISLDLRNSAVTMQLDKIGNRNRDANTGPIKERKRNDMEKFFDSIAANDESITEVDISGDINYTGGLSDAEKVKSALAFANNTHVTKVTMNALQLGDDFAIALGKALTTNETIERLIVEGNAFTGAGFKGLFEGLGMNNSVLELQGKHQSKKMTSADEEALPSLLDANKTITKISMDLRNSAVTMQLDKIGNRNRDARRKMNKKTSGVSEESTGEAAEIACEEPELKEEETAATAEHEAETEKAAEAEELASEEGEPEKEATRDEPTEEATPEETPVKESATETEPV